MEARPFAGVLPVRPTDSQPHRLQRPALLFAGLLLSVFITYLPALRGEFLWDDGGHVTENAALYRQPGSFIRIWREPGLVQQYYPLTFSVFDLEFHVWENWTPGYHLLNILLHTLNAFLLAYLLVLLEIPGAWLAAFLFALHPVGVESVAWISELKNVLSTFFFLSAVIAYWRFEQSRRREFYAAAFLLFAAALFSKTVTSTFPGVILVLLWWKNGRLTLRDGVNLLPFAALGAWLGAQTAWLEKASIGASGAAWVLSPWQHVLLAGRILWFYVGKLAWPYPLLFFYPRWSMTDPLLWIYPAGILVAAIVLATWARRGQRGPLAALLLFAGMLVPALGFFPVYPMRYSYVADHFQYVACLPWIALAAAWLSSPKLWKGVPIVLCVGLALLSVHQAALYQSDRVLWEKTAMANPTPVVLTNWAGDLIKAGQDAAAIETLQRAIALDPSAIEPRENLAEMFRGAGRLKAAITLYQEVISLQPTFAYPHYQLATLWKADGDLDQASAEYETALRRMKESAAKARRLPYPLKRENASLEAHTRDALAEIAMYRKNYPSAEDQLNQAIVLDPAASPLHAHRALVLLEEGKPDSAIAEYQVALALDGSSAEVVIELANLLWKQKRPEEARAAFSKALTLDPQLTPPVWMKTDRPAPAGK